MADNNTDRIKAACAELAARIIKKNDMDKGLRLLRPSLGRSGDYIAPIKSRMKQKLVDHHGTDSNHDTARVISSFDKEFECLRHLYSRSPRELKVMYSFIQVMEPLCFSLPTTTEGIFNTTLLIPIESSSIRRSGNLLDASLSSSGRPIHVSQEHEASMTDIPHAIPPPGPGHDDDKDVDEELSAEPEPKNWLSRDHEIMIMRDLLYIFQVA